VPSILICLSLLVLSLIWYQTFPESAWGNFPNYLVLYIEFVTSGKIEAFLWVKTGPGGLIEWVFLPAYAMIGLHAVLFELGRRRGIKFVKVNAKFIVYLVLLGPLVISIQNASQYYNWYWDPVRNAPGFVDVWTHVTSSLLLGSLLAPFAFERFLGWERKWFWFPVFALLMASSLLWEIGETIQTMDGQSIEYSLPGMVTGSWATWLAG
jgi:hypothetical protein